MRISDWSSDVCSSDLERLSDRGAGAPPDRPWHQPQRGWDVELEVRQLPQRLARLRHAARRYRRVVGCDHLPYPAPLWREQLGLEPGARRSEEHTSELQSLMRN